MTSRELTLACLGGQPVPHPPVLCGGGMMSFAVEQAMDEAGSAWPAAHTDPVLMADLALQTQRLTGFDCAAVPFCMTVEAESLGAAVDLGTRDIQPRIIAEPLRSVTDLGSLRTPGQASRDRRPVVLEALRRLRRAAPDLALIGAVVGPLSLAAQVLEASLLLRATRRDPSAVHALVARCADLVTTFACDQVRAGADLVVIADPTATGEILGDRAYRAFAHPYLDQVAAAVASLGAPVVIHICGRPRQVVASLAELRVAAISVDETAALRPLRAALTRQRLMGNISADLLHDGPAEAIAAKARAVLQAGVDILAPACGVIASTPPDHLAVLAQIAAQTGSRP